MSASEQVLVVDRALRGIQLDAFLERELVAVRRAAVRDLIAAGKVRVNGQVALAARRLRPGDVVELLAAVRRGAPRAAPAPELEVLFESATALVVHKPSGLPTVPDRSGRAGVHGRLEELRPDADLRIVHRLDHGTSGCLLLAKGLAAARHFDAELRSGRVQKRYCAIVHGVVAADPFTVDLWLGPDPRRPGKVVAAPGRKKGFRAAHTAVVRRAAFARHALVELVPTTGRGHQLRVHLAAVGHPIVGDADYGGEPLLLSSLKRGYKPRLGFAEPPVLDRVALHAEALRFRDVDGADVAVDAPMPEDLTKALARLERFARPR